MCEIRTLSADDWAVWREVRLRSLADAPEAFGSKLADWQGVNDREDLWRTRFENVAYNAVAVAESGSQGEWRVVGTVGGMHHSPGTVELVSMWVAPEERGAGVGDALVDAVVRWARAESASTVILAVRRGNEPATSLYERKGFVLVGANPDDAGEDRMVREIADEIRTAIPDDADAVTAYHQRCFHATYGEQLRSGELQAPDPDGMREQLHGWFLPDSGFDTRVVVADGTPIAHVTTRDRQLLHLFVDPHHQGVGWGRRLLEHAEARLAAGGHEVFELHARVDNPVAIAFYEATGWMVTDQLVHTDEHGISYDEHVLVKQSPHRSRVL